MNTNIAISTGHLAMFQAVTAVLLIPDRLRNRIDDRSRSEPGRRRSLASRITITRVTRICSGRSFQNGRPSGVS